MNNIEKETVNEWDKFEERLKERNKLQTEVGDILIVTDDMPFRIVRLGYEGTDKHPYGLLCMRTNDIDLWAKSLDFKIGDELFGEGMIITSILKKKTFEMLKNL